MLLLFCSFGDIAQLARAPALQAGGREFESLCLHQKEMKWLPKVGEKLYSKYNFNSQ